MDYCPPANRCRQHRQDRPCQNGTLSINKAYCITSYFEKVDGWWLVLLKRRHELWIIRGCTRHLASQEAHSLILEQSMLLGLLKSIVD